MLINRGQSEIDNVHDLIRELLDYARDIPKRPAYLVERNNLKSLLLILRSNRNGSITFKKVLLMVSQQLKIAQYSRSLDYSQRLIKISIWSEIFKIFRKHLIIDKG